MHRFGACLEDLQRDARVVQRVCDEIIGPSRLRKVLSAIVSLGKMLSQAGTKARNLWVRFLSMQF